MPEQISDNRRIAKNTLMLYFRMFLMMGIGLLTSRVLLHALGASDIGINSVVGGIVAMLSFFNGTLAGATQRFITYALGESDMDKLKKVFSTAFFLHLGVGVVLFILIETVGLWFLYNKMVIPSNRINAAFWLLQFSAVSTAIGVTQVPYNACIIAHEKMGTFAYFSILDAIFKLAITYAVWAFKGDKLILYGFLWFSVGLLMLVIYRVYSIRHFEECHIQLVYDKSIVKNMLVFSGWNVGGTLASVLSTQGYNLLLNTFFGTLLNAANSIMNQVNNAVMSFAGNFQTASNPQITKLYASREWDKMHHLVENTAKFSGYLVLLFAIPIIIEIDFVLELWLGYGYPKYTAEFIQIIMVQNVIYTMSRPLVTEMLAIGELKIPCLGNGTVLLMILPISYVLFRLGWSPVAVMMVNVIPWVFQLFFENWFVSYKTSVSPFRFIRNAILKVIVIGLISFAFTFILSFRIQSKWLKLIVVCFCSTVSLAFLIYNWGLNVHLKTAVKNKTVDFIKKLT